MAVNKTNKHWPQNDLVGDSYMRTILLPLPAKKELTMWLRFKREKKTKNSEYSVAHISAINKAKCWLDLLSAKPDRLVSSIIKTGLVEEKKQSNDQTRTVN